MNSNGFLLIWIAINQTTLHVFSFRSKNLFQKKSKKSRAYDFDVSIKYVFSVQNSKEYANIIILIIFWSLFQIRFISQEFNCMKVREQKILRLENISQRYYHILSNREITTIETILKKCLFGIGAWGLPNPAWRAFFFDC